MVRTVEQRWTHDDEQYQEHWGIVEDGRFYPFGLSREKVLVLVERLEHRGPHYLKDTGYAYAPDSDFVNPPLSTDSTVKAVTSSSVQTDHYGRLFRDD